MQLVGFIRERSIFVPNGTKPVTEVEMGDIVLLGQQLCIVTKVSEPYSTRLPMDYDMSTDPKRAVVITGQSIFWPDIEYAPPFVRDDHNMIGTFSGVPEPLYEGDLVSDNCSNTIIHMTLTAALVDRS